MGIPIEYHIILMMMSLIFFFLIFILLFVNTDFYKTIGAMILIFINIPLSFMTGLGFFSIDLYGYDSTGQIISNIVSDYSSIGFIFIALSYISLMFLFYAVYLLYEKPWSGTKKIEGNPYVNYYGTDRY